MTFFSILIALVLEQLKPLRADNPVYALIKAYALRMESWFNAGEVTHGRLAWGLMMASLALPAALIYWLLNLIPAPEVRMMAVFFWNVLIVYLTLGFRHYSHYFSAIQLALSAGDESRARQLLADWTGLDTVGMEVGEVCRIAVERALVTSHRSVFGVFFWFLMPVGPACAIMYRLAEYLARAWNEPAHMKNEVFGQFAQRAFDVIDWIPVRLTAIAFAIVGNFEDAIYCWRNFASRWREAAVGIILASGSGALGVRLGTAAEGAANVLPPDAAMVDSSGSAEGEAMPGEEPGPRALQSTVALVWRALVLWMMLLLLLSVAVFFG